MTARTASRWPVTPDGVLALIAVGGLIWAMASAINSTHHTAQAVSELKDTHKEDVREIKAEMREANIYLSDILATLKRGE